MYVGYTPHQCHLVGIRFPQPCHLTRSFAKAHHVTNSLERRRFPKPKTIMTKTTTTRNDDASSPSSLNPHLCIGGCGQPIPTKRLAALPKARICVQCLEAQGDVPPTRRMDEVTPQGDRVETYFTNEPAIERYIQHMNTDINPADAAYYYAIAVGDDNELIREGNSVLDVARPLASEFDDVEPSEMPLKTGYSRGEILTRAA